MERSHPGTYDRIGRGYRTRRLPDPRIAAQIQAALGDAQRICNVGAGTGSYEPRDRQVVAVEPSREMISQRPAGAVVRARAEALPFIDNQFDAVLALLTVHHWVDVERGLAEIKRIAPVRVLFTFDPLCQGDLWLVSEYLPEIAEFERTRTLEIEALVEALGDAEVVTVPVAWDCSDGFQSAYWRRPQRYLEADVRASISTMAQLPSAVVERAMSRLAADLDSGAWARRHAELLARDEMDYGYRLVVSRAPEA